MREAQPPNSGVDKLARRVLPAPILRLAQVAKRAQRRRREPRLGSYMPVSTLELPKHDVHRACLPAIDFHAHLGRWLSNDGTWMVPDVGALVETMDQCNVSGAVNLDGRWGTELEENLDRYDRAYPGRFFTFCHLDWRLLDEPGGLGRLVASLERSVATGARGLKVWKDLGMEVRAGGRLMMPDDAMLRPLWEAAAQHRIPVLIHVGDPVAFFRPVDVHNERYEELLRVPRAARPGGMPEFRRLMDALEAMVASNPSTSIVAAHCGYAENLSYMSNLLNRYPNLSVDIGWRACDLGRQPRAAREFVLQHPDRVLFGTDALPPRNSIYRIYFRFLETADENFDYSDEPVPPCGRWTIHGLDLPQPVLRQVYRDNARHLLAQILAS